MNIKGKGKLNIYWKHKGSFFQGMKALGTWEATEPLSGKLASLCTTPKGIRLKDAPTPTTETRGDPDCLGEAPPHDAI